MTILHDAYTALLSGLTTKTGQEIHWKDEDGALITVEPIDIEQCKYIVRYYLENGNKYREIEYQNDQLHGKHIRSWENGNKRWEEEYREGQLHGKCIEWYENGNKRWETKYRENQRHGKSIEWWENGNKSWEQEYQNGKKIK